MPKCFCPEELGGARYFVPCTEYSDWNPTHEHFPVSKMDGGHRTVDNSVLAHRLCNRIDHSIRVGRSYRRDLERIESAREDAIRRNKGRSHVPGPVLVNAKSTPETPRSMEQIEDGDLKRLGRAADADLDRFFERNPHLLDWRERVLAVALAQGGAEHRLRNKRGIWDLDVIVCFANVDERSRHLRRPIVHWDWGPSKFGRCPYDPPEYTGRAVDVKYWVIPGGPDPVQAVRSWLEGRLRKKPDPARGADIAHEPVILIRPEARLGEVIWDPDTAPPAKQTTSDLRRRPVGLVPP
jgi:hypothetical protein